MLLLCIMQLLEVAWYTLWDKNTFYSVQQGSRYILSLTNQRSWFEVRWLQHHQQIKAHGQHMVNKTWLERVRHICKSFAQTHKIQYHPTFSEWDGNNFIYVFLTTMNICKAQELSLCGLCSSSTYVYSSVTTWSCF